MRRRTTVACSLVVAGGLLLGLGTQAGRILVVADPLPATADAVVVLAGAPAGRLLEAARLYAQGIAPRVVLTRERRTAAVVALERAGVPTSDPAAEATRHLEALGVPAAAVTILDGRAYSTASEARLIARWACRSGIRTLVVVTSPSHTRRARAMLRRLLPAPTVVATVPARADFFPQARWWRSRRAAKLVLGEYQKLANYWLRERRSLRPCGA